MLIAFAVTNFRSLQARQVFSMLPSTRVKERSFPLLRSETYEKLLLQPTAVLYGANNSGKSNFLKAVYALKWLVEHSGKLNSEESLEANEFFLLNAQTENQPTTFEMDFIAPNQLRYRYLVTFDQQKIISEVLSVYNHTAQGKITLVTLFDRNVGKPIKFGDALRGRKKDIEAALNRNQLFLSKADNYNQEQLLSLIHI
jgi:AAA15 family ATPase/GTPase